MQSSGPGQTSLVRAALALGGMVAAVTLADRVFEGRPLAGVLLGAVAVDLIASRAGAGWGLGPRGPREVGLGLGLGAAAAAAAAAAGLAAGQVRVVLGGTDVVGLLTGTVMAVAAAFRSELLLRWAPWALLGPGLPRWGAAALGSAFGAASALGAAGAAGAPASAVALGAALGGCSGALISRTGGLPASLAAAAAVRLLANPTPLGVELRWSAGALAPLEAARGPGAWWLAAALLVAGAVAARVSGLAGRPGDPARPR